MAEGCSRTQDLVKTLPLTSGGFLVEPPPAYSLAQAMAVSNALLAYYEDEPTGCTITLPNRSSFPLPQLPVQYPLEAAKERQTALLGILSVLETSEKPTTARHLFGVDLKTLRWALRSEKNSNLLVGWLYAATFSDLNGIEEPVMALAEQGATPQIQAAALVALLLGMPERVLKAYDPRVRALARAASTATDALVREQGQWLLARADAIASGTSVPSSIPQSSRPSPGSLLWAKPEVLALFATAVAIGGIALYRWRQ